MIIETNQKTVAERQQVALKLIAFNFKEAQEMFLRRSFDNSIIDATALAVIELAKQKGFNELADEMKADFKSELNRFL